MKSTTLIILAAAIAALGVGLLLMTDILDSRPHLVSESRELMGERIEIAIYHHDGDSAKQAIDSAFSRMVEVESVLSPIARDSEVNELNRSNYLPSASDTLVATLRLANVVHRISGGAFDVSAGALRELWTYDAEMQTPLSDQDYDVQSASVSAALKHVGMDRLLLGSGRQTSISLVPGTLLDLGPLAMGTAIDAAIDALRDAGIEHALVGARGHWRAIGGQPDGSSWAILPNHQSRDDIGSFLLADSAMAIDCNCEWQPSCLTREARVLDPRTGYPIARSCYVGVVAPTAAEAGALAASVLILGEEPGLALIDQLAYTEMVIQYCDNLEHICESSGMTQYREKLDH